MINIMMRFLMVLIILTPNETLACEQSPISIEQAIEQADVIFYGKPVIIGKRYLQKIVSKDITVINDAFAASPYEVIFEVQRIWKGAEGSKIYMLDDDSSCSSHFAQHLEQNILIFAKFDDEGLKRMQLNIKADTMEQLGQPIWEVK